VSFDKITKFRENIIRITGHADVCTPKKKKSLD
jgi:hypothetical protein